MKLSNLVPFFAALATVSPSLAQAGTGGFRSGDLYLYSPAIDAFSGGAGVVHIDPGTGETTMLHDVVTGVSAHGAMCYDPFRDRLLFYAGFTPNHTELYASDGAGNLQSLGFPSSAGPTVSCMAARGDGIVYMLSFTSPGVISYLDPSDQLQTLMDASGAAPYAYVPGTGAIWRMHYDAPTNSLVVAGPSMVGHTCPTSALAYLIVRRLDLSADGTRVLSESCLAHDVGPGGQPEIPVGLAQGPEGDLIVAVSNNTNQNDGRLVRIDVGGMTSSTFATNDYLADNTIVAGCFSQLLGKAVFVDSWNDVLRAYSAGEFGLGAVVADDELSYSGVTGEVATLVEILHATPLFGLRADTTEVSLSLGGTQTLDLRLGAGQAGQIYLVLGSASGWNPGLVGGGAPLLPLNQDGYFLYTLFHPNGPLLPAALGLLGGAGEATAGFTLPPGTDPGLAGLVLHHGATVLDLSFVSTQTTNSVPVELIL